MWKNVILSEAKDLEKDDVSLNEKEIVPLIFYCRDVADNILTQFYLA
ncbi:MAG: hypothetical protein SAK42_16685 [Oscillatoria sp. PMC 1076.18]|nr:hypothetical protein [Oscillatoria sp. PMC 1076.18]